MNFAARAHQLDRLEAKLSAIDNAIPSLRTIGSLRLRHGGRAGFARG